MRPRAQFWAAFTALFLFGLVYRVLFLRWTGFDGLYGLDAYAYHDYLAEQLRPALLRGEAPPPFHWPLGYPMLAFVFSLVFGGTALASQAAAVFGGAMCGPLMFTLLLQCRPGARGFAFLGGLYLSTSYYAISMSTAAMSDLPGLMWALLAACAMLAYTRGLRARWLALAALALAAALLTRWVYALMAVPLGCAALAAYFAQRPSPARIARHAALAIAAGGAVIALHFAPSLARDDAKVAYAGNLRDYSWSPANYFRRSFETADGLVSWPQPPAQYYLTPLWNPDYIAPIFVPFLPLGLYALLRRAPRPAAALLTGWALVFYLFFAGVYMQNNRFPLSYFPPLIAAVFLGLDLLSAAMGRFTRWPRTVYALVACFAAAAAFPHVRGSALEIHYTQTTVIPREIAHAKWAGALVPPRYTILAQGNSMILSHNVPHRVVDLFNLTDAERRAVLSADGEVYLMIDPPAIERQWMGRRPMEHLAWFAANTQLTEIGARDRYRLYRAVAWALR